MSNQAEFDETIRAELQGARAYYIQRQKIVAQALTDMGLDLHEIAEFGPQTWGADLQNPASLPANPLAERLARRKLPQMGIWFDQQQNMWRYFLRGKGCRLINLKTGETIDWDCPDLETCQRGPFINHLLWQVSSPERAGNLSSLRNILTDSLDVLSDGLF